MTKTDREDPVPASSRDSSTPRHSAQASPGGCRPPPGGQHSARRPGRMDAVVRGLVSDLPRRLVRPPGRRTRRSHAEIRLFCPPIRVRHRGRRSHHRAFASARIRLRSVPSLSTWCLCGSGFDPALGPDRPQSPPTGQHRAHAPSPAWQRSSASLRTLVSGATGITSLDVTSPPRVLARAPRVSVRGHPSSAPGRDRPVVGLAARSTASSNTRPNRHSEGASTRVVTQVTAIRPRCWIAAARR